MQGPYSSASPSPLLPLQLASQTSSTVALLVAAAAKEARSPMVIAIEAALSALLQDLDVAVAERDFAVARNTLDVGMHVLAVLDRDADILSVEVRAAARCCTSAWIGTLEAVRWSLTPVQVVLP